MADIIQIRRDTAANWTSANPTLAQGEMGYETDTDKVKIGDGTTAWTSLGYVINTGSYLQSSDIGSTVQGYSAVLAGTTASFTTADESKLDGIEASATADQTAQEIATAIDADATAEATIKSALGLGTAAYTASTAYATAAQGALADSAVQPSDNISGLTNDSGYITGNQTITLSGDVSGSGTTSISVTVADDSHNHVISNIDNLQTTLDAKASTGKAIAMSIVFGG